MNKNKLIKEILKWLALLAIPIFISWVFQEWSVTVSYDRPGTLVGNPGGVGAIASEGAHIHWRWVLPNLAVAVGLICFPLPGMLISLFYDWYEGKPTTKTK